VALGLEDYDGGNSISQAIERGGPENRDIFRTKWHSLRSLPFQGPKKPSCGSGSIESGSGSSISSKPGYGSTVLMIKKLKNISEKFVYLFTKNCNLLIPSPFNSKGHPSHRRSLQPSEENRQHLKDEIY
jgi:hypothetical protein